MLRKFDQRLGRAKPAKSVLSATCLILGWCIQAAVAGNTPKTTGVVPQQRSAASETFGTETSHRRRAVVAFNSMTSGTGTLRPLSVESPWPFQAAPVAVGRNSVLRYRSANVYAVSRTDDRVTIVDALDWTVTADYALDQAVEPADITVIDSETAYISDAAGTDLLRMNLKTGATQEAVSLAMFADADGIPDMNMMELHDGRLFIQIQRTTTVGSVGFEAPPYLAVVDVASEEVIDVDPAAPGVQAIALLGTSPKHKMLLRPGADELILSSSGELFDQGGIERVDLSALTSLGLIVDEVSGEVGADLGSIVMVAPDLGYLVFTTDFGISSHLHQYSVTGGVIPSTDLYTTVGYRVPAMAHDRPTDRLFYPESFGTTHGIHVFDAQTAQRLTDAPVPTDGVPTDVIIACGLDDDGDGEIDLEDYAAFRTCLDDSGPVGTLTEGCGCFDVDVDEGVTLRDFAALQVGFGR